MTAAKLYQSKSKPEDESPLLKNQKYRKQVFDSINSIKFFENYPSLNSWLISLLYFILILALLFLLTPPALVLLSIFVSLFLVSIVAARGSLLSMTSQMELNVSSSCIVNTVDNYYYHHLEEKNFTIIQSENERIMWIWCIIIAYTIPELINSMLCFHKSKNKPSVKQFLSVVIPETLYAVGIALMVFFVLPKLNLNSFVLFLIWCIFEWGLHTMISTIYGIKNLKFKILLVIIDIIVLACYVTYTMFYSFDGVERNNSTSWITILALALIHGGFWQDVPDSKFSFTGFLSPFVKARKNLEPVKHYTFALVSIWKIIVFIASSLMILSFNGIETKKIFSMFESAFSQHNVTIIPNINGEEDSQSPYYSFVSIIITKGLNFPILVVFFQIFISSVIYMKRNTLFLSLFHGFDFRSRWGLNIPCLISIVFFWWSALMKKHYCNLADARSAELVYFFDPLIERPSSEILRIFSLNPTENWEAILLKCASCWIMISFWFRSRFSSLFDSIKQTNQENKPSQPVNVYLVTIDEKPVDIKNPGC
ncbi:uncharacterized protein LOC123269162 [Cotesia glomerata]|uniref:Odorant receptor n=1 Tax=Cotesia glomerata TaxID=32391 RepID=A0AAV7I652_COTGL|nr:uncharacterized protein LOC123269162 [Cotesia glomerata]KAH0546834.1 hypothetical protein KQX54_015497 [Cotesia glomerata]